MLPKEAARTTARRVRVIKRKKETVGLIDWIEGFLLNTSKTQDKVAWAFLALVYAYLLGHVIHYLLR